MTDEQLRSGDMTTTKQTEMGDSDLAAIISAATDAASKQTTIAFDPSKAAALVNEVLDLRNALAGIPNPAALNELLAAAKAFIRSPEYYLDDADVTEARLRAAIAAVEGK